jgi:MSHA biogenesis protein MshN
LVVVESGMSVINKMLKDLDQRQALGAAAETSEVRPQVVKPGGREWFWRLLVVLLTAALAWMGWVAVQLLPRKPIATELAFQAAAEAQSRAAAAKTAPPAAPAATPAPAQPIAAAPAPPAPVAAAPASETLRLATELEKAPAPEPIKPQPATPEPAKAAKAEPAKPAAAKPKPAAQAAAKTVDKRERARSTSDAAEAHFRRAALFLNHGRVSEAEDQLIAALNADPSHHAARQTYVAVLLEQRRVEAARRLLQDALAANPAQPTFAFALARIHVESRDYQSALEVIDRAGPSANSAEFQSLRGAVLQRLGRHPEAVEAYENAIRGGTAGGTTWIGFAISLEALGRRTEAAQAYRRALTAGPVAAEAREYAETRVRALE